MIDYSKLNVPKSCKNILHTKIVDFVNFPFKTLFFALFLIDLDRCASVFSNKSIILY